MYILFLTFHAAFLWIAAFFIGSIFSTLTTGLLSLSFDVHPLTDKTKRDSFIKGIIITYPVVAFFISYFLSGDLLYNTAIISLILFIVIYASYYALLAGALFIDFVSIFDKKVNPGKPFIKTINLRTNLFIAGHLIYTILVLFLFNFLNNPLPREIFTQLQRIF